MIKGFIFDMDGVITSSSQEHFGAWCYLLEREGYIVDPVTEEKTRGVSRMESLEAILDSLEATDKYTDEQKLNMAEEKNQLYVSLIERFTPAKLYEGVLDALQELKDRGYKIGLGSASKNGPLLLERLEITQYFDFVADVSQGLRSKPAPDIFLEAARGLGLRPQECIGIEDAIAGVEAIKAAGMIAVGIGDAETLKVADIIYPNMECFDIDTIVEQAQE